MTEHLTKDREVDSRGNCSKCGGTHYGSYMCPMSQSPQGEPALTPPQGLPGTSEPVVREPQGNAGESPAHRPSNQCGEIEFACGHTVAHEEECPRCEIERLRAALTKIGSGLCESDYITIANAALDGVPVETFCDHSQADARGQPGNLEIYCVKCGQILRAADETKASPQAPIARLIVPDGVAGGAPLQVELYEPGLPPGEHDLYCEPEATAPYMRAEKAGDSLKAQVERCPVCLTESTHMTIRNGVWYHICPDGRHVQCSLVKASE